MWIMKINNVPDKVFDNAKEIVCQSEREVLRVRSSYLAAIGEGRELMFVLGVLPPTVLSNTAYLWLSVAKDIKFTKTRLKVLKKVFPAFIKLFPYQMIAEVETEEAARFAKFLGGVYVNQADDRAVYGWSK